MACGDAAGKAPGNGIPGSNGRSSTTYEKPEFAGRRRDRFTDAISLPALNNAAARQVGLPNAKMSVKAITASRSVSACALDDASGLLAKRRQGAVNHLVDGIPGLGVTRAQAWLGLISCRLQVRGVEAVIVVARQWR